MQKKHSIRKLLSGKGYYIVLAVCILAVGVSALIFYRTVSNATGTDEPAQTLSVPATTNPANPSTAAPSTQPERDTPQLEEEKSVPTASLEPEAADPEPIRVVAPVEGETIAAFSADALAYNPTMADWRTHDGVDIGVQLGDKVYAIMDGVVAAVYEDDYLGTVVVLEHAEGWRTLYANLTAVPAVDAGDSVHAGQVIGAVGQTAMLEVASQPHLHLEVYRYGALTDPALLLG